MKKMFRIFEQTKLLLSTERRRRRHTEAEGGGYLTHSAFDHYHCPLLPRTKIEYSSQSSHLRLIVSSILPVWDFSQTCIIDSTSLEVCTTYPSSANRIITSLSRTFVGLLSVGNFAFFSSFDHCPRLVEALVLCGSSFDLQRTTSTRSPRMACTLSAHPLGCYIAHSNSILVRGKRKSSPSGHCSLRNTADPCSSGRTYTSRPAESSAPMCKFVRQYPIIQARMDDIARTLIAPPLLGESEQWWTLLFAFVCWSWWWWIDVYMTAFPSPEWESLDVSSAACHAIAIAKPTIHPSIAKPIFTWPLSFDKDTPNVSHHPSTDTLRSDLWTHTHTSKNHNNKTRRDSVLSSLAIIIAATAVEWMFACWTDLFVSNR